MKKQWIGIALLVAMGALSACGGAKTEEPVAEAVVEETEEPTETPTPEPTEEPTETPTPTPEPTEEPMKQIGVPDGETVYSCIVVNETGKEIKGVAIKLGSAEEYPDNLMTEDDRFADQEKRRLFYDASAALEAFAKEQEEADPDAPLETPEYRVAVTYADDVTQELHAFPFEDTEEVVLHCTEDVTYITYASKLTGEEVSTEEAEKAILEMEKQEALSAEAADATQQTVSEQTYTEPVTQESYEAPAAQESQGESAQQENTEVPVIQEVVEEPAPQETYVEPAPQPVETVADPNEGCLGDEALTY